MARESGGYSEKGRGPGIRTLAGGDNRRRNWVGMTVVVPSGNRDSRALGNFYGVMVVVVPLMSDGVTNIPETGQRPDGDEQRSTPSGRPKPTGRLHWDAFSSPCHSH